MRITFTFAIDIDNHDQAPAVERDSITDALVETQPFQRIGFHANLPGSEDCE